MNDRDPIRESILDALAEIDALAASAAMLAELPDADRAAVMRIADDLLLGRPGAVDDTDVTVVDGGALAALPGADWLIPYTEGPDGVRVGEPSAWQRQDDEPLALMAKADEGAASDKKKREYDRADDGKFSESPGGGGGKKEAPKPEEKPAEKPKPDQAAMDAAAAAAGLDPRDAAVLADPSKIADLSVEDSERLSAAGLLVRNDDGSYAPSDLGKKVGAAVAAGDAKGAGGAVADSAKPAEGAKTKPKTTVAPSPADVMAQTSKVPPAKREANEKSVAAKVGVDEGTMGALTETKDPDEPIQMSPENAKKLSEMGLVTVDKDGIGTPTAAGRKLIVAAQTGDAEGAHAALSEAKGGAKGGAKAPAKEKPAKAEAKAEAKPKEPAAAPAKEPAKPAAKPKEEKKPEKEKAKGGSAAKPAEQGKGGMFDEPAPPAPAAAAANRAKTVSSLDLHEDGAASLEDLATRGVTDDDGGLAAVGLAERTSSGQYRLTAEGKAVVAAANKGDVAGARDAASRAADRAAAQSDRQLRMRPLPAREPAQGAPAPMRQSDLAAQERMARAGRGQVIAQMARAAALAKRAAGPALRWDCAALTKVGADDEQIVEGYASSEVLDNQPGVWKGQAYEGDVVDAAAINQALPAYLEYANIREMHQPSAVGLCLKAEVIPGDVEVIIDGRPRTLRNPLHLVVKVVDPAAWAKVKAGVYKGFSIGGAVVRAAIERQQHRLIRKISELALTEISLVDRPANPDARIVLWKAAAHTGGPMATIEPSELATALRDALADLVPAGELLEKAAADATKVVSLIQQLRNEAELQGDIEASQMYTQAITLVLQASEGAAPAADAMQPTEPEGDEGAPVEGEPTAEPGGDLAMRARATTLRKAGRVMAGARMKAMGPVVKGLLQLMADAGDELAALALRAYGGKAEDPTATTGAGDGAAIGKALGAELGAGLKPLADAVAKIQSQQGDLADAIDALSRIARPGGPAQRTPVAKRLSTDPAPAAREAVETEDLSELKRLSMTEPQPVLRAYYQNKLHKLTTNQ